MGLFSFLLNPRPARARLSGEQVASLLRATLHKRGDYQHFGQKRTLAVVTQADLLKAESRSWMPWQQDRWECEDQCRAAVDAAQRSAANEGCSWACGVLRAQPPASQPQDSRHVYVWAVTGTGLVIIRDITARAWIAPQDLREVDYTMT